MSDAVPGAPGLLTVAPGSAVVAVPQTPRLVLRHPVFKTFEDPFFRLSDIDQRPVLVIRMDDHDASLPIAGMMREFGISALDEDGRMLALVVRALPFVTGLRIGDRLPPEILSGEASWEADEAYHARALARMRLGLAAWIIGGGVPSAEALARARQQPMSEDALMAGLRRLSHVFGGLAAPEAMGGIESVAAAYAHVEELRSRLLRGARRLYGVVDRMARNYRGDTTHKDLLMQLRRLAGLAMTDLTARFDAADRTAAQVDQAASRPDASIAEIRMHRDGLYARCRAWEPYIIEWGTLNTGYNSRSWSLAHETYRFLAPRYMTVVEWRAATQAVAKPGKELAGMTW